MVSSRWTMSPLKSGEWGSNPRSPASKAGGLPLSYPLSGPRGTCTLISGVRSRRRPVGPAARCQESGVRNQGSETDTFWFLTPDSCFLTPGMIPDGLEPSLPGCGPGVFAAGPRDQDSSRGRNRTDKLSPGSRPGRFTDLRTRPIQLRRPDSNRRGTAYETVLEPDSSPLRSDQGESRTPMPLMARRSERRVSTSFTTWPCSSYGNRTHLSSVRGWRPRADRRTSRPVRRAGVEPAQRDCGWVTAT